MVLAFGNAGAAWSVQGQQEPSTAWDTSSWMFRDPSTSGVPRIYFNGMLVHAYSGVNPNSGILGGNHLVPGAQFAVAYLGIWRDCNHDGFIGAAETATLEYRSVLLLGMETCPRSSGPYGLPPHNDGEWVRELLWIGWGDNAANPQAREPALVDDAYARVWADEGRPGDVSFVGCPSNPPKGTFSTTGALLAWLDCYGARETFEPLDDAHEATPAEARLVDLHFEDEEHRACSATVLNQPLDLFYRYHACPRERPGGLEPGSGRPAVFVWDCDNTLDVNDPDGRPLASQPLPRGDALGRVDPHGSVYDGASHVAGGVDSHCSGSGGSRLDNTYVAMHPEQPVVAAKAKRETTFALEFFNDRSGSYLGRVLDGPRDPPNAGLNALNSAGVLGLAGGSRLGSGWQSQVLWTEGPPLLRDDLTPAGPSYYTYYAYVGAGTTSVSLLPSGAVGTYGSAWCGGATSGIYRGTDCAVDHWWNPEHGASEMPRATWSREPYGVRPGQLYQLRDVDCHDGAVVPGVRIGLSDFSNDGTCR